jgi:hypothetical protein
MTGPREVEVFDAILRQDLFTFIGKTFGTIHASDQFTPNWHIEVRELFHIPLRIA